MEKSKNHTESRIWKLLRTCGSSIFRLRNLAALLAASAVFCGALWAGTALDRERSVQKEVASQVIRFHVLAESDRHPDQQIKLQVRDRLLEKMSIWLEETETLEETRECLNSHLEELTREAEAAIREAGGTAGVTVEMTRENFPVRVYGQYRFPAGEYETLRVKIGSGGGHNWWCLIFPSLCFQNSLRPVISRDGERKLKYVLSDEAYDSILQKEKVSIGFLWF